MKTGKPIIGFKIDIIVESDENGYHAYVPALKGLHTCGDTKQEALKNAKDAAIAYLQSLVKNGDPIPVGVVMRMEPGQVVESDSISHHTEDLRVPCTI